MLLSVKHPWYAHDDALLPATVAGMVGRGFPLLKRLMKLGPPQVWLVFPPQGTLHEVAFPATEGNWIE
jgi:hypothetical protein